jgi:hypothetical protein
MLVQLKMKLFIYASQSGSNIHVYFIGLIAVDKADAKGVLQALLTGLSMIPNVELNDLLAKWVAYGCDGASVNTGKDHGVIALSRHKLGSHIVMVHCMAHRLELAYNNNALKKSALYDKLITLLSTLYSFYKAYLQRSGLKQAFTALNLTQQMPTRIGGTRWLSHTKTALGKMLKGYPAIVLHLEQNQQTLPKAKHMMTLLQNRNVIVFAHFMMDLLTTMGMLSVELQRTDATLHECYDQLQTTMLVVEKYKNRYAIIQLLLFKEHNFT